MKCYLLVSALLLCSFSAISQTAITAVTTSTAPAVTPTTYIDGANTYNWGVSPNNTVVSLTGFTAGAVSYLYDGAVDGTVKLRRVDNVNTTGNLTLVWSETLTSGATFNMFPEYQNDLEAFLDNNIYNKGADNLLANSAGNSNNIERFDWIVPGGYSTDLPAEAGFPIFDRGNVGVHDSVVIAAITSLDASNNPASYGAIVRVASADYGDAGPNVDYRVFKATVPSDLLDQGVSGTQSRGGVFISLQDLGIAPGVIIYGYSLFATDLPASATAADLVLWTNTTFFPTNTSAAEGGIELLAVTGIFATATVLPTRFISFDAVENNSVVNLNWTVENETSVNRYEIERSTDGINYLKVNEIKPAGNGSHTYSIPDNVTRVSSNQLYYRIKQYDQDGSYYLSKTIAIKRDKILSIVVYPNPVIKSLFVNIPSASTDRGVISVTNSAGAQVISQQIQLTNGNNSFSIDRVSGLPTGMYQLSVKLNSGKSMVKQFSKQ